MLNKNIENFLGCDCEYDEASVVLFGAPFDSTTSFKPGARFASKAIRGDSYAIETYSPYQDKDLTDIYVFDSGDIELPMGSTEGALNEISTRTKTILNDGKIPLMIGGEHLVTLGAMRAVHEKYNELYIIHFDAHADLRDEYLGVKLSHASVMRRCWELVGDDHIFQFGIRSGDREEFKWSKDHTSTQKFNFDGIDSVINKLAGKNVYLTIDLDVLDPSVFPGTGTPEAGGVTFMDLMNNVIKVCSSLNIVACDINELSPIFDQSGVSTLVACKIIRELILAIN